MRGRISKAATIAIVVLASGAAAGQRQSGPGTDVRVIPLPKPPAPMRRPLHHTAVVERLLSFDANRDDRIARDELPERMEGLVSRGDKNNDTFLTRDEVIALVDTSSPVRRSLRLTARGAGGLAEIIADLKLPAVINDRALKIVQAHTASRNPPGPVSREIDTAMRELLDDEDYENFVAAAARLRQTPPVIVN
jgi:hypothetical protein